jgi:hypothetical protein
VLVLRQSKQRDLASPQRTEAVLRVGQRRTVPRVDDVRQEVVSPEPDEHRTHSGELVTAGGGGGRDRLASLLSVVSRGDGWPLGNAAPISNGLVRELKVQTGRISMVLTKDLAAFIVEALRLGLNEVP